MESGTVAGPMPDLKAIPCDLSVSAPSANCSMDLERRAAVLGGPLPLYPDGSHQGAPGQCASVPAFHSSALLANLGLQCCPGSGAVPLKHRVPPAPGLSPPPALCVNAASSRLYRSMENLHWAALPDPGLLAFSAPYGSVDSEFIFRCTATSHWSEGVAFCPAPRASARRDLPLLPHWLFPGGGEAVLNGGARRGLREKLRLHSVRVTEPNKPLRPLAGPGPPEPRPSNGRPGCRITSPEEIKQEALRRLQLRRQNSSPDLTLHPPEEPRPSKSRTAEALGPPVLRRPPAGRLHIPTFEEFKKMRKKESGQSELPSATGGQSGAETGGSQKGQTVADTGGADCVGGPGADETCGGESGGVGTARGVAGVGGAGMVGMGGDGAEVAEGGEQAGRAESDSDCRRSHSTAERCDCNRDSRNEGRQACLDRGTDPSAVPICTSPTPRTPLQPLATPHEAEVGGTTSNAEDDVSHLTPTTLLPNSRAPPTCCPALLLDSTDLSSYGAKISKMKDGFLGSALDLIKKSCSAEIAAEAPVRLARDQDAAGITPPQPGRQSAAVSMTMPACSAEDHNKPSSGGGEPAERQQPRSGCRRSSSDAAYELAELAKTQRECRLRPHFSDPMPASTTKRKQLEMKIAAVARLHSQHRDFDDSSGQPEPGVGVTRGGGGMGLSVSQGTQHRWSNVSSLSADSGVMGLSDERDEREDEEEPPRARRSAGDVERADSGIGPGLALGWKRPPASLGAWEAHQACTDCGQRDRGGRHGGMCERCLKQRTERKEAVLEFLNTESSYGEDLRIIKEEFLCPMQSAGLLTPEQLAVVFGNVQELIDVNDKFTEHLQDSIEQAFDQGDEDLQSVCIGEIFLEFSNMLPAFQTYCLQQSAAVNMLNALEKEKELLRIFLDVSQNDNTALRRMNLRSFLMAPLQRVTKYPLLLSRISKATAESHPDHGRLREAKSRVESHLEHVNTRTKQEGASWSLRSFRRDSRRSREVANMEMRELCMRTVGWARESTRFVMEGPLQISQPADGQWVKKGSKALKFQNLQSLLMVQVQGVTEGTQDCGGLRGQEAPPEPVRDGVLVLIKDKSSGKFSVLREPIRLGNCVVSSDPECEDTFEVLDIRREAFVLRAADKSRTQQWFRQIKRYSRDLGPWRKRRNALPNIMISTTQNRS